MKKGGFLCIGKKYCRGGDDWCMIETLRRDTDFQVSMIKLQCFLRGVLVFWLPRLLFSSLKLKYLIAKKFFVFRTSFLEVLIFFLIKRTICENILRKILRLILDFNFLLPRTDGQKFLPPKSPFLFAHWRKIREKPKTEFLLGVFHYKIWLCLYLMVH